MPRPSISAMSLLAASLVLAMPAVAQDDETTPEALALPLHFGADLEASGFFAAGEADAACAGQVAVVRFNSPAEGGSMAGFRAAVAAHDAWLDAHGYDDVNVLVIANGGGFDVDDSVVFGAALIYPSQERWEEIRSERSEARDEDYTAFVQMYGEATSGYVGMVLCLEPAQPAPIAEE